MLQNGMTKALLKLMSEKKTNLALSADVTRLSELIKLATQLGNEICILKTHVDILEDFSLAGMLELAAIAKEYGFLIFEDRKFADIGNTVKHQYQGGIYRIADWADIINAHALPGPGIISGLQQIGLEKSRGLLLLASMSSAGNLLDAQYAQKTLHMAEEFPEFVMGFIAQRRLSADSRWVYMTPGVQIAGAGDGLGQQYVTPEKAIIENGSDVIIVGRGILGAKDRLGEAKIYRERGWGRIAPKSTPHPRLPPQGEKEFLCDEGFSYLVLLPNLPSSPQSSPQPFSISQLPPAKILYTSPPPHSHTRTLPH